MVKDKKKNMQSDPGIKLIMQVNLRQKMSWRLYLSKLSELSYYEDVGIKSVSGVV